MPDLISTTRILLQTWISHKKSTSSRRQYQALQGTIGADSFSAKKKLTWIWPASTKSLLIGVLTSLVLSQTAHARTIRVGPDHLYNFPSQAAKKAHDGDIIEIEAGEYPADVALWRANNLTIRGVGGMAHMKSGGKTIQGKAIWVFKGNDATVEHIGFHDAKVPSKNGAGIRLEGTNLTVRHSLFRNNQNGILTGKNPESEVLIEHTEFDQNDQVNNSSKKNLYHNIYIGLIRKFTLRDSVSRRAKVGHQVKSRAAENIITNNKLADEVTGTSSYLIDLPSGGRAYVAGNTLQQGALNENSTMISFGAENLKHPQNALRVENNTFINDSQAGCRLLFVKEGVEPAIVTHNRFVGCKRMNGPIDSESNVYQDRSALPPTSERD